MRTTKFGVGLMVLCLVASAMRATVRAAEDDPLAAAVQSAKTAADHEAIAKQYDQLAADAKRQADRHELMAARYANMGDTPKAAGTPLRQSMPPHCKKLVQSYQALATQYEMMAKAHRQMAAAVK